MTATDPTAAALLAAVVAAPDDDLPRLVYADYLEEHGEGRRAEFIRRQCENAAAQRVTGRCVSRLVGPSVEAAADDGRVKFDALAASRPWRFARPDHVSPVLVVGGGRRSGVRSCVAWHRGLPAVVACTERQWHKLHREFPGPLEAVCLSASGAWGAYSSSPGEPKWPVRYGLVSLVDPDVKAPPPPPNGSMSTWEAGRLAWPRVRRFLGPCALGLLRQLAAGTLPEPDGGTRVPSAAHA